MESVWICSRGVFGFTSPVNEVYKERNQLKHREKTGVGQEKK